MRGIGGVGNCVGGRGNGQRGRGRVGEWFMQKDIGVGEREQERRERKVVGWGVGGGEIMRSPLPTTFPVLCGAHDLTN